MDTKHTSSTTAPAAKRPSFLSMALVATLAASSAFAPAFAADVTPASTDAMDVDASVSALAPGDFIWMPERTSSGQVVVVVSLPEQRAHVYRNGVRIGVSTISTGTEKHPTPTGTFEILQKKPMNYSNLYNNAPMPFMQRLTWDGIALHAGKIPGYPASHGCVRLPLAFAKKLYAETERGMMVVIADETSHDMAVVYPGDSAPVDAYSGEPLFTNGGMTQSIAASP